MSERLVIDIDRDGWTRGLQLNISRLDEDGDGTGWGYRLHGPKYNGSSTNLLRHELTERDAAEIRAMLDAVFPLPTGDADAAAAETGGAASDFFQPGRTYTHGQNGYRAPEMTTIFRVEHVTRHPARGHLRAIGWSRTGEPGAPWHGDFYDEGEFDGWVDIADGGDAA